ncbi:hypothetical protein D4R78_06640 [bacterium]|nr:MAG: hypothetical protein D4R78_06640 [bacterium]
MRGVIKGALAEELENSLRMQKGYENALNKLPKGCLSAKNIKGHKYYYLVQRKGNSVKYLYKGKVLQEEIDRFKEAKVSRARYRNLLSKVKRQVKFLRSSLRGKEAV